MFLNLIIDIQFKQLEMGLVLVLVLVLVTENNRNEVLERDIY